MSEVRLIDANALKKEIESLVVGGAKGLKDYYENGSKSDENAWIGGIYDAWELVDNAPTVEPTFKPIAEVKFDKEQLQEIVDKAKAEVLASIERPQGEWIVDEDDDILKPLKCSNCNEFAECFGGRIQFLSNFCPNCGADMKGGAE